MINLPWTMDINGVVIHCGLSWFVNTGSGFIALVLAIVGGFIAAWMTDRGES